MDITDVPLWQWILACWITTWGLVVFRTWSRIIWLLKRKFPKSDMARTPTLHLIVYILCINFLLLIVGIPITLYDDRRDQWVKAYVNAVGKKT